MGTYKEASERMLRTGNGITDPLKHSSFQEYIVNDVCMYFFELDPIFKDRPNVTPLTKTILQIVVFLNQMKNQTDQMVMITTRAS